MIIFLGISKQENFHRSEKPLEKTQEIDNEARISKKAKMKREFNRNQKRTIPWDIQISSLIFLIQVKTRIYIASSCFKLREGIYRIPFMSCHQSLQTIILKF